MHAYMQEPDANRFLEGAETLLTREQIQQIVARHMQVDRKERCVWAITLDNLPIGAITVNYIKGNRKGRFASQKV